MKAPIQASDISREWLQYILTDYESRENPGTTVIVDSFENSAGSQLGEGFIGEIIRVYIKATVSNAKSKSKEYNLAIKLNGQDPRVDIVFKKAKVNIKELLMYSKVLKEFNDFQNNLTNDKYPISYPKFIYGKCTTDEFVLVMGNIKDMGYCIHNKEKTFNLEHIKIAVTQLARLHAISYSYDQSHPFLKKHSEFEKTDYGICLLKLGSGTIFDVTCKILEEENNHALANKIKAKKKDLVQQCEDMHNEKAYKLLCLVHGDAHARNMMFKYDEGDEKCENPTDVKLLDWQLTHWNTPAMDLQYLIYSSTSRELRKDHLEEILQFYHSTFVEATRNMDVEVLEWTYEDFRGDFSKMAFHGFVRGVYLSILHHCPETVQENEHEREKAINQSKFMKTLSSPLLKLSQEYILSKTMQYLINLNIKRSHMKGVNQIITRENKNLASRVLGLIYEANENGLFGDDKAVIQSTRSPWLLLQYGWSIVRDFFQSIYFSSSSDSAKPKLT